MRCEKPHSLSYHEVTFTSVPSSITMVPLASKRLETVVPMTSLETMGSSV